MGKESVIKTFMEENEISFDEEFVIKVRAFGADYKDSFFFDKSYQLVNARSKDVANDYIIKEIVFGDLEFYKKVELTPLMQFLEVGYGETFQLFTPNNHAQDDTIYFFDSEGFLKAQGRSNSNITYEPSPKILAKLIANQVKVKRLELTEDEKVYLKEWL